jgi:transposase
VVHERKTESTAQAIANELAKAPSCRRIVFETGRMAPILFHGLSQLGLPVDALLFVKRRFAWR